MISVRRSLVAMAAGLMLAAVGLGPAATAAHAKVDVRPATWGAPVPVTAVNDPVAADGCPIESPDGRSLYIASMRGPGGDNDIWVATRSNDRDDFGAPMMLPEPVNSDAQDFCPTPLKGGGLLFVSTRGGTDAYGTAACGAGDIYITHRNRATGEWAAPRNLGCAPDGPNGPGMEYGPSLVHTWRGTFLYFSSGAPIGGGTQDIYVSRLGHHLDFGPPEAVTELNTAGYDDFMPNVSKDGREIVFASSRPGGLGASDIYTSVRRHGSWNDPVNLGSTVNTAAAESRPSMSSDGSRLYFGRSGDIYVSERGCRGGRH